MPANNTEIEKRLWDSVDDFLPILLFDRHYCVGPLDDSKR